MKNEMEMRNRLFTPPGTHARFGEANLRETKGWQMSIRYEREPVFCTHLSLEKVQLVEYTTPADLAPDGDLAWVRGATECLDRKRCGDNCPGEAEVLRPLT